MFYLYVFLGGGLGALSRYGISQVFPYKGGFPLATFLTNLLACLVLGFLMQKTFSKSIDQHLLILLATGFCGGFSTFSTFSYETFQMLNSNQFVLALIYVLASVVCCLLAIWIGLKLSI